MKSTNVYVTELNLASWLRDIIFMSFSGSKVRDIFVLESILATFPISSINGVSQ